MADPSDGWAWIRVRVPDSYVDDLYVTMKVSHVTKNRDGHERVWLYPENSKGERFTDNHAWSKELWVELAHEIIRKDLEEKANGS